MRFKPVAPIIPLILTGVLIATVLNYNAQVPTTTLLPAKNYGHTSRIAPAEFTTSEIKPTDSQPLALSYYTWGLDSLDGVDFYDTDGKYNYNHDGSGVTVYVMDSGVNPTNDLTGRVTSYDFTGDANTVNENKDCYQHGTMVADIVAGTVNGVAKKANIVSLKVLNCSDLSAYNSDIIKALEWLTVNHAPNSVLNISMSGEKDTDGNDFMQPYLETLISNGVTVVASAGNSSVDACNYTPAFIPNVITVGAYDFDNLGQVSNFSNQGACLDIFAPGNNIKVASPILPDEDVVFAGTSASAPFVAGAAAIYLQTKPSATPAEVTEWLVANSKRFPREPFNNLNLNPDSPDRVLRIPYVSDVVTQPAEKAPVVKVTKSGKRLTLKFSNVDSKKKYVVTLRWKGKKETRFTLGSSASQTKKITVKHRGTYSIAIDYVTMGITYGVSKTIVKV